jgi:lipoyl-dependent peroxiredoxin
METNTVARKVLYTAKTHTTGARGRGRSTSSDGILDVKLTTPGTNGGGTNPEQLFAAGWSACFESAMGAVAQAMDVKLPDDTAVDAEVDLTMEGEEYFLQARLNITIPGVDKVVAHKIVDLAQRTCPYSKAVHGNINVAYNLL